MFDMPPPQANVDVVGGQQLSLDLNYRSITEIAFIQKSKLDQEHTLGVGVVADAIFSNLVSKSSNRSMGQDVQTSMSLFMVLPRPP